METTESAVRNLVRVIYEDVTGKSYEGWYESEILDLVAALEELVYNGEG